MRVFLAIPLPSAVLASLDVLQHAFQAGLPGIRWVRSDQRHITVKFFGELSQQQQQELSVRAVSVN